MPTLGPMELIIIVVIILIFFGAGRLKGLGTAVRKTVDDFKSAAELDKEEKAKDQKSIDKPSA